MNNKELVNKLEALAGQIQRKPKSGLNFVEDYKKYCEEMRPSDSELEMEKSMYEEWIESSKMYAEELGHTEEPPANE